MKPAPSPPGREQVGEVEYFRDAKGALVPAAVVKPMDALIDVDGPQDHGLRVALSDQLARFKQHTFRRHRRAGCADAAGIRRASGGAKGNKTLTTYEGLFKVQVQVADRITFGAERQVAKALLLDERLNEWSSDARPELKAIVTRAFNTDKEGQINRAEIFTLLRLEIDDPRWKDAMRAIRDAIRVEGTQTYVRAYRRDRADLPWQPVTIDLAKA